MLDIYTIIHEIQYIKWYLHFHNCDTLLSWQGELKELATSRKGSIDLDVIEDNDDYDYDTGDLRELEWDYESDVMDSNDEDVYAAQESSGSSYSPSVTESMMDIDS